MRILFVCLGNICRSPMAEGLFGHVATAKGLKVELESAGTGAWHVGEPPDNRGQATMHKHGIDISGQRARQVQGRDFEWFDLIVPMDRQNRSALMRLANSDQVHKIKLFLEFAEGAQITDVPDPYYGAGDGFEHVYELLAAASEGLAAHVQSKG